MIITDFYSFQRFDLIRSATRIDCVESTASYPKLEEMRARKNIKGCCSVGDLFVYLRKSPWKVVPDVRKPDYNITKGANNISGIFVPNLGEPHKGYGDMLNTPDAILFNIGGEIVNGALSAGSVIDIFICRGLAGDYGNLYESFLAGEYDSEIEEIKARAKKEKLI